jgi:hypothetical protein
MNKGILNISYWIVLLSSKIAPGAFQVWAHISHSSLCYGHIGEVRKSYTTLYASQKKSFQLKLAILVFNLG